MIFMHVRYWGTEWTGNPWQANACGETTYSCSTIEHCGMTRVFGIGVYNTMC